MPQSPDDDRAGACDPCWRDAGGRPLEVAPRHGLLERLGPERFHPTVGTAVDAYVAETGVDWREEDSEPNADPEGR